MAAYVPALPSFVKEKENLVLMGVCGTGKTHLATTIALSLCKNGRHVRFYTAIGLANILQERHHRGMLTSFMTSLRRVELLVLDGIGFVTRHKDTSELPFQIASDCYEQPFLSTKKPHHHIQSGVFQIEHSVW